MTPFPLHALIRLGCILFAALSGPVQAPTMPTEPESIAPRTGAGVSVFEGELWGVGDPYRIRFDERSAEFHPAFGEAARERRTLRLSTKSFGRDLQHAALAAAPTREGTTVSIPRGGGVTERYHVRPGGAELTYVFAERPAGEGDLVVRLEVDTELAPTERGGGLAFRLPGVGSVVVGAVTGVDAEGRTAPGSMRLEASRLELSLPADFVDTAAYPLVLDPILETDIEVSTGYEDLKPDVAYDASTGVWLAVWLRRYSFHEHAILGRRFDADGDPLGGAFIIDTGDVYLANDYSHKRGPVVASVNFRDRFVVAWSEEIQSWVVDTAVVARSVDALTGAVSPKETVAADHTRQFGADIAGEPALVSDHAFIVWERREDDEPIEIWASRIHVAADGSLIAHGPTLVSTPAYPDTDWDPAISRSGGPDGRYAIVWTHAGAAPPWVAEGVIVNRDLHVLDEFSVAAPGDRSVESPEVDGDGTDFFVAYHTNDHDTYGIRLRFDAVVSTTFEVGSTIPFEDSDDHLSQRPAVSWLGSSFLVGFLERLTFNPDPLDSTLRYHVWIEEVDPVTGAKTGLERVDTIGPNEKLESRLLNIASRRSGSLGGGPLPTGTPDAFLVWQEMDAKSDTIAILGATYGPTGGKVQDVGGGDDGGGHNEVVGGYIAGEPIRFQLLKAPANEKTTLLLGTELIKEEKGSVGTALVTGATVAVAAGSTSSSGYANLTLSTEKLPGKGTVYAQWLTASKKSPTGVLTSNVLQLEP